jgi:hypothetical protein
MPLQLSSPKETVAIDQIRIASFKVEDNPYRNQYWIEVWCVLGRIENGAFVEYTDPATGAEAVYYKIENGKNPLDNDQALGRCNVCGVWHKAIGGSCTPEVCNGTVQPYDGFSRLALGEPTELDNYRNLLKNGLYSFMTTEEVPDPVTDQLRMLIEAEG